MQNKLRIAFFGGRILGYKCLEIMHRYREKIEVVCVIVNKKDGVEGSDWNPALIPLSSKYGFPAFTPDSLKDLEFQKTFAKAKPDVLLNAFCNRIVPSGILNILPKGAINFHYGKLPKYQGRFIINHIILNGEKETCATAHFMDEKIDSGDIIFEEKVEVKDTDTAKTLYMRATPATVKLFEKVLKNLINGKALPRCKQKGRSNYFPFEEPNHCLVDLNWKKDKIERFIRALTFEPISKPRLIIGDKEFEIIPKE